MQHAIKDQKAALDGAMLAVHVILSPYLPFFLFFISSLILLSIPFQQAAQIQSRAVTPAVVELTPAEHQIQLKHMIDQGRLFEAFQRVTEFFVSCGYFSWIFIWFHDSGALHERLEYGNVRLLKSRCRETLRLGSLRLPTANPFGVDPATICRSWLVDWIEIRVNDKHSIN